MWVKVSYLVEERNKDNYAFNEALTFPFEASNDSGGPKSGRVSVT